MIYNKAPSKTVPLTVLVAQRLADIFNYPSAELI